MATGAGPRIFDARPRGAGRPYPGKDRPVLDGLVSIFPFVSANSRIYFKEHKKNIKGTHYL
jgi:hypothetical protein